MNGKRATIKDIAREASVSGTTISRYLNGKFEYMSGETRQKIEKVIEELDYRPSNIARSLKSNESKVIGAVIADIENYFSTQIIKGLMDKANELGYSLMISVSNNDVKKEKEGIERFLDNRVDGLIINTVFGNEIYLQQVQKKVPVVFIDRGIAEFEADTVTTNNFEMGLQMMDHLVTSQFRSIGYFTEEIGNNTVRQERYRAFQTAAQIHEKTLTSTHEVDIHNEGSVKKQLNQFYRSPEPRVIFCNNGVVMQTVLKVMKDSGYQLTKDFSLCGYDNWLWASLVGEDGLTAIEQDSYALGTESVDLIYKRLNDKEMDEKAVNISLEGRLIVRGSTKSRT